MLRRISKKGIKIALATKKHRILYKAKGIHAKTKVGVENLNIGEKAETVRAVSINSPKELVKLFKTILFKPVRQVSHFGLVAVILVVLLTGIPAPKVDSETEKRAVDPFGITGMTSKSPSTDIEITELESVAMTVSFISDELSAETYEQMNKISAPPNILVAGDSIAKPGIAFTASSAGSKAGFEKYAVQNGDTLSGIAKKFGITTDSIKWSNNMSDADFVKPGQELLIPSVTGIIYTVKAGDSVESIASRYKTTASLIVTQNDLYGESLTAGMKIIVPDGIIQEVPVATPKTQVAKSSTSANKGRYGSASFIARTGSFKFPTSIKGGNCGSGSLNGYHWYAFDLCNSIGTPIYAADAGRIVEASYGYNGGYGNTILIDHGDGFQTRYAHMSTLVILGGYVSQGQTIGYMGSTGRSTGSHLHFEVIKNGTKINPANFF